jgi:nucleoside-triphosphatase THEP1
VKRALLLTGQPGTGKTALIEEALARIRVKGGGCYTEEIRTGGIRQGFRIVTLGGQKVLGTIMFNPHRLAGEIKRHPEVEVLLVTRDNRTQVMKKVLNWLREGMA